MSKLCKDKDKTERDAKKAKQRQSDGKSYFECKKCERKSHKEDNLCKPKEIHAA